MKATISVDADEHRVVWVVYVEDDDGNIIDRRPFRTPEEANDYIELLELNDE